MNKHPTTEGVLFPNDRKQKETHPDFRGHLDISKEMVNRIVEMAQAGLKPELKIAAWNRESRAGAQYFYVSAEAYMPDDTQQARPSVAAPPPAPAAAPLPAQPTNQPVQPQVAAGGGWGPATTGIDERTIPF
jgi:uncharacterized protein (DUF736 family)